MIFNHNHYVPCLRWKLGEYQAVLQLSSTAKENMTPLIEVPEIGYDFEKRKQAKSIDDHLAPFARRVKQKWHKRQCFVDLNLIEQSNMMADGQHPVTYVFSGLRTEKCEAVPVIGIDRNVQYRNAVRQIASEDRRGVCFRITIEQAAKANIKKEVDKLLSSTNVQLPECDLILDLSAPNFIPISGLCKVLKAVFLQFPYRKAWRTFTILGTSFPRTMAEVKKGGEIIERCEWILYKMLVSELREKNFRIPTFGDYAVSHPNVLRLDMRLVKPCASIRYTINDAWWIIKGLNVRDYGFQQYTDLCKQLVRSRYYFGAEFSAGDQYIFDCANSIQGTGNLTIWRRIGTNHHLEKVMQDIANLSFS